jgi:hypothetical protein
VPSPAIRALVGGALITVVLAGLNKVRRALANGS